MKKECKFTPCVCCETDNYIELSCICGEIIKLKHFIKHFDISDRIKDEEVRKEIKSKALLMFQHKLNRLSEELVECTSKIVIQD
jgi:hypothetical protein